MNNRRCLLALLLCCVSIGSYAQQIKRAKKEFRLRYHNVVSLNFPTYLDIGGYPGVCVGMGYEHFFGQKGFFSADLSLETFWAGTNSSGKLSTGETRANIKGYMATPGFFYHPRGIREGLIWSIGPIFPIGNVRRYDVGYNYTTGTTTSTLAAVLLQGNLQIYPSRSFAIKIAASWGPLLSSANTEGHLWMIGLKFGKRF